ncbi:hypothetical protein FUA39_15060 [Salmonella enterica]|nr:hypothetical protein [Salmonella enterica]EBV0742218.1 hypothetical protein [Salmonella enterica subsp. enterica serovar Poona]ECB7205360.1 hypothetical protein [Salmonella enterica subsp. enterica serovar Abaetetuba]ECC2872205.1 hypothetical protein [Salmonella enterica subsp. enterica serovar Tanger]ECN7370691.1 hypothetical protein [Salmonella enterica subsp. enterica serovar Muenchen]
MQKLAFFRAAAAPWQATSPVGPAQMIVIINKKPRISGVWNCDTVYLELERSIFFLKLFAPMSKSSRPSGNSVFT